MSSSLPPDVDAALRTLREHYRVASIPTLATFETIAARLAASPVSPDALADLLRELHRVRGSAGSYGYMSVSRLAGTLEARVTGWTAGATVDLLERSAIVERFVTDVRHSFEGSHTSPDEETDRGPTPRGTAPGE